MNNLSPSSVVRRPSARADSDRARSDSPAGGRWGARNAADLRALPGSAHCDFDSQWDERAHFGAPFDHHARCLE